MAQTILYYPTIDIQDSTWLRNALLYWDNISSIVPYVNYSDFSPELLYLQDCGVYKPAFPQDLFYSEYASDFTEAIITKLERYNRNTRFSCAQHSNRPTVRIHRDKIYTPALHELIHYKKMDPELLKFFSDRRYINDFNCGGWMEIDSNVASIYMKTLAEFIVKCYSEDIVIGTSQLKYQNQFYTPTKPREGTACISLELDSCLPQPAMDVGFEEMLDFKKRHKDDFAEFRKKLREYEIALSKCSRIEELKFETENFKENWQSALRKEQKLFTSKKTPFVLGTLHTLINVPAIADPIECALQKFAPTLNSSIASGALLGGTAAISLGYKFVSYRRKINEHRSGSGFSYIIKASKAGIITSL